MLIEVVMVLGVEVVMMDAMVEVMVRVVGISISLSWTATSVARERTMSPE